MDGRPVLAGLSYFVYDTSISHNYFPILALAVTTLSRYKAQRT